jgi:hypothetical protein
MGWARAAIGAVVLVGCGGSIDSPPPARQIPLEELPAELTHVLCGILWRCCDAAERMEIEWPEARVSREACEAYLTPLYAEDDAEIPPLVAIGRIIYHPEKAGACIDTWAAGAATCRALAPDHLRIAACRELFEGTIADGGSCTEDEECIGGTCDYTVTGGPSCRTQPGEGASCAEISSCGYAFTCLDGVCQYPRIEGEACTSYWECATGVCGPSSSASGANVCQPPDMCNGA